MTERGELLALAERAVEASLGATSTNELAVMCDTFRPLRLTTLARELDDPSYAKSWYDEPASAPAG